MPRAPRIAVIGAGIGGLAATLDLTVAGCEVLVFERASSPGGKIREVAVGGRRIDAGPTVFTMRWVFDELFDHAGTSFTDKVVLRRAEVLARHAWSAEETLDLFSDIDRSAAAIGAFAGPAEALRYREFCARSRRIYETLEKPFLRSPQPSPFSLAAGAGLRGLADLWRISPFTSLWQALGEYFHDPRLRQLFARYATYCGSSPFEAPATLMLVAHVERQGVWLVDGGMKRVAQATADLAAELGAALRYDAEVAEVIVGGGRARGIRIATGEDIPCDAVVLNADPAAMDAGLFGRQTKSAVAGSRSSRSLSAVTWALLAETAGFELSRHNVFFSTAYEAEFSDIFQRGRLPRNPTVYVCAADRDEPNAAGAQDAERLFVLVNAPPTGDGPPFGPTEIDKCKESAFAHLSRCGLQIVASKDDMVTTTPVEFNRLFPAAGGALYGPASHGWSASFSRPTARTRIPGLYLAGGSTHPGPGVPMAALSGRLAAQRIMADLALTRRSHRAATPGGTSMP